MRIIGSSQFDPRAARRLRNAAERMAVGDEVVFEQGLDRAELVRAYQRARVFVSASDRESFCLPLLEALACGVPAVVRRLDRLREAGGDAATYVDGDDPVDWARALRTFLEDEDARAKARAAGIKHAAGLTLDRTVQSLVDALRCGGTIRPS